MKLIYTFIFLLMFAKMSDSFAQKIDSIYINLYTDSLKKGTYNYINVDGLLPNGKYIPLDSNHIHFSSSYGKFIGNSLVLDKACKEEKVHIRVNLKNSSVSKEFVMYVKKKEDDEKLPTSDELMNEMKTNGKKKKKS